MAAETEGTGDGAVDGWVGTDDDDGAAWTLSLGTGDTVGPPVEGHAGRAGARAQTKTSVAPRSIPTREA